MSELFFKTAFKSSELQSLVLPVEIHKPNLALVARSDTSQSVNLDPGIYYVSVKLPAGQVLLDRVTMSTNIPNTAILAPAPGEQSPFETLELSTFISGKPVLPLFSRTGPTPPPLPQPPGVGPVPGDGDSGDGGPPPLGLDNISARLRVFAGNIPQAITLEPNEKSWVTVQPPLVPDTLTFFCSSAFPPLIRQIQLLQSGERPLNVLLPVSPQESCQLLLRRLPDMRFSLDIHMEHIAADALVHYFQQGLIEQTAALTKTNALQAEELLQQKLEHPIAAAAGAYALLRLGDLERLHSWTENLYNWFVWLPDGAAIRGEHLARIGQHEQALSAFLSLSKRGLPLLSDGLSYAVSRLRTYVAGETQFEQAAQTQTRSLLKQLQRFAAYVDFRIPFLTYSGLDPNNPDDLPVGVDISAFGGLDVIPLLMDKLNQQRTPPMPDPGFIWLFDGSNTDKWRMSTIKNQPGRDNPGRFLVVDDTLEAVPGTDIGLYWHTEPTPADFILKLEWLSRREDDDSGVFIRFPHPDSKGYNNTAFVGVDFGFEVQIDQRAAPSGAAIHKTGAIYNFAGSMNPDALPVRPLGQWNTFEIWVQGQTYTVSLNGMLISQFTFTLGSDDQHPDRGLPSTTNAPRFIGLQIHTGHVAFRNIQIRAL